MKIKSIRDIRIRTKLMMLGAVSILGLFVMGSESVSTAHQIDQAGVRLNDVWMNAVIVAEELNTATSDYRIVEGRHAITTDAKLMETLEGELAEIEADIEEKFRAYRQLPTQEEDQEIIEEAYEAWQDYLICSGTLIEVSHDNDREQASRLMMGESQTLFDKASGLFLKSVEHTKQSAQEARAEASRLYERLNRLKLLLIAAVSSVVITLVVSLIRAIKEPSEKLTDAAWRAGNGNLDSFLEYRSEDELGTLTTAMNQLLGRLRDIIRDQTRMFQEIGDRNFDAKSGCEQAYRGDFAPLLYGFSSLESRLKAYTAEHERELQKLKKQHREEVKKLEAQIEQLKNKEKDTKDSRG